MSYIAAYPNNIVLVKLSNDLRILSASPSDFTFAIEYNYFQSSWFLSSDTRLFLSMSTAEENIKFIIKIYVPNIFMSFTYSSFIARWATFNILGKNVCTKYSRTEFTIITFTCSAFLAYIDRSNFTRFFNSIKYSVGPFVQFKSNSSTVCNWVFKLRSCFFMW